MKRNFYESNNDPQKDGNGANHESLSRVLVLEKFWKSACDFLRRIILSCLQTPQSETMELTFPRWPNSCVWAASFPLPALTILFAVIAQISHCAIS